jgi:hypothetical protein
MRVTAALAKDAIYLFTVDLTLLRGAKEHSDALLETPGVTGQTWDEAGLMALRPTPVVIVSTPMQRGASAAIRALELGAIDCVGKPLIDLRHGMTDLRDHQGRASAPSAR